MSKPVIASDFDCVREFVSHGRNGLLVGANDDRALSRAIGTLLVDRERARHMGHDNHLVAMMKHNPRTNGARANGFYERVLGSA